MRTKLVRLSIAGAAAVAAVAATTPSSEAVTATVPNMFWRTCTIGCSGYVQSNGPYNSSVISECITKGWFGNITSTYYKWGRC